MYQVIKRDGGVVNFDLSKISSAIRKAFDALEKQYNDNIIDLLALKVTADYEPKIKDGKISVEAIQDSVEDVLVQRAMRTLQSATSSTASREKRSAT